MTHAAPATTVVPTQRDFHQRLATATRRRRQAAGVYARPTAAQVEALRKSYFELTLADLLALSTCQTLHEIQRNDYAKRYQAMQTA